ncbi:MAG: radical SAM protein [Ignavibacteriaceae bacterium]|nr:radical SAM protein [Ignavibacteriaceae bacterium]
MKKTEYLTGARKMLYNQYIKIYVFFHFLGRFFAGEIKPSHFIRFLRRLLYFLSKMKLNKYVKTGKYIKLNLYVPVFPSKAFFKACKKVYISDQKMPCISVLISVTSACRYNCEHCYQKLDRGKDLDIGMLCEVTKQLDKMGVSFFNIEGGEPFLVYDRLKKVCESVETGEIWVNSTGDGMTPERLAELKAIGVRGVMFSIHSDDPEQINSFMQSGKAWENLTKGIEMCHRAGLEVASNTCIEKEQYFDGTFEKILDLTKSLGVSIIQLIKPKPSGGWLGKEVSYFSQSDIAYVESLVHKYNNDGEYRDYPFIAAQIFDERSDMFGCTAGGTDRFYINAKGDVQPCEFLNISYGNLKEEEFSEIYDRMRRSFEKAGDRWLCETCSAKVAEIVSENNITSLPLNKELSQKVIENWDRGKVPEFYDEVTKI